MVDGIFYILTADSFTFIPGLLILLLDWHPCLDVMRIAGRWCSTTCTEDTETLEYTPELVIDRYFIIATFAPLR